MAETFLETAVQNICSLGGVGKEVEIISSELSEIQALLKDAEQNEVIYQLYNETSSNRKLEDDYEMDDLFNEYVTLRLRYESHAASLKKVSTSLLDNYGLNNSVSCDKIGKWMKEKQNSTTDQKKDSCLLLLNKVPKERMEEQRDQSYKAKRTDQRDSQQCNYLGQFVDVNGPNNNSSSKIPQTFNNDNFHLMSKNNFQIISKGEIGMILEATQEKFLFMNKLNNNSSDGGENIRIIIETNQGEFLNSNSLNKNNSGGSTRIVHLYYDSNQWMSNKKKICMILVERIVHHYCHSGRWSSNYAPQRIPYDLPCHEGKKSIVWPIRAWLLLIAALLATITYQVPFRFSGSSIMSRAFLVLNSMVFDVSVVVTLFLLHKFPMKPWPQISILAMFGSYMYSIKAISPKESLALLLFISVAFVFLAAAGKLYTLNCKKGSSAVTGMV